MSVYQGQDYVEGAYLVGRALSVLPVERTGQALASSQGTLTIITRRIAYVTEIVNNLPLILIDVNDESPIRYRYEGTNLYRGIPYTLGVFTPMKAFLDNLTREQILQYEQDADLDIKTLVGDIESVLNSEECRRRIGKHLELTTGAIAYDALEIQPESHVRVRVATLWFQCWNLVKGH